jgi:membrane AbrB-like protein
MISVLAVCALVGIVVTRMGVLPGSTALWGLSPGAATAMIVLAEDYGADSQLVAVMQYLRVVLAVSSASLVTHLVGLIGLGHDAAIHAMPATLAAASSAAPFQSASGVLAAASTPQALQLLPCLQTLALALGCALLGHWLRIPGGPLLLPIFIGLPAMHYGWMTLQLPTPLLALAYAIVGWRVGLRFTPALLAHAARMMPRLLACTFSLIAACGGVAGLLVLFAGLDPLTAYLATSPGAADSVAIIAASSKADVPFVVTLQVLRFLTTLALGPVVMRLMAGDRQKRVV